MTLRTSVLLCLALLGCNGPPAPVGPEALLTVTSGAMQDLTAMPFPSDVARSSGKLAIGDLGLDGQPAPLATMAASLDELDGFGVLGSVYFPLSDTPPQPVSGSATVIDLTAGDPALGQTRSWPLLWRDLTKELAALAPLGAPLVEGHTYGCFVEGQPLHPSQTMADALAGRGPAASVYAPLVAQLGADRAGKLSAATVFTTGHPTARLDAMIAVTRAQPPPVGTLTLSYGPSQLDQLLGTPTTTRSGFGDPKGVVHDAIGWVLHGTFATPSFISATPGHLGAIQLDGSGQPMVKGMDSVPFVLILPKCAATCSYQNQKVVIFQHGINSDRAAAFAVANDYARAGYATLASDALFHGSRRPGSVDMIDNVTMAAGPDGIGDPSPAGAMIWFFDFNGDKATGVASLDPRIMRDNFLQGLLDLTQVVRLAKQGDVSALAAADSQLAGLSLDASHLVYTGESFGSLLGTSVLAASPDLDAAVLAVGGGGIVSPLMVSSPAFAQLVQPLFSGAFDTSVDVNDPTLPPSAQRSLAILQTAIEPGDPAVWAPRIAAAGKSVLFLQANHDEVMPNQAGDQMTGAAGATQIALPGLTVWSTQKLNYVDEPMASAPFAGAASTVAVVQLEPACHGMFTRFSEKRDYLPPFPPFQKLPMSVPVSNPTELTHALAVGFFDSYRAGVPQVIAASDH
jgi:hypothetical protein